MIFRFILTLVLFLTGCSGGREQDHPPAAAAKARPPVTVPEFDGANAYRYLSAQVEFGPRVSGTKAHDLCRDYLVREMEKSAEAVNLQPFTIRGYDGSTLKYSNIISSFNLKSTTRILLLAHWDSRPWADEEADTALHSRPIPGANDGASGVAVLLEIARHLKAAPPGVGVDILFTDGEDYGRHNDPGGFLHGARHFASNLPQGYRPVFGVLLDMVGDASLVLPREQHSIDFAPDVVDLVWGTARRLGYTQFVDTRQGRVTDDHLPLNAAGIRTIDLIDFDYPDESNRYWHTLQDTPDKCSPGSLEAVGSVLLSVVYEYAAP
jgi:glutaminyl-peptide cyclotransferase